MGVHVEKYWKEKYDKCTCLSYRTIYLFAMSADAIIFRWFRCRNTAENLPLEYQSNG